MHPADWTNLAPHAALPLANLACVALAKVELWTAASVSSLLLASAAAIVALRSRQSLRRATEQLEAAQAALLSNERLATQLFGQQMVTEVYLVKALGGGWEASQIQNEQAHPKAIQAVEQ